MRGLLNVMSSELVGMARHTVVNVASTLRLRVQVLAPLFLQASWYLDKRSGSDGGKTRIPSWIGAGRIAAPCAACTSGTTYARSSLRPIHLGHAWGERC